MCDCVQSTTITAYGGTKFQKYGLSQCNSNPPFLSILGVTTSSSSRDCSTITTKNLRFSCRKRENPFVNWRACAIPGVFDSNGFDFSSELGLKERENEKFEVGLQNDEEKMRELIWENEGEGEDDSDMGNGSLKREKMDEEEEVLKGEVLVGIEEGKSDKLLKGKQLMKRSSMLAKQVIGIQSALSLGFVSQLWVDTTSWTVLEVEVRPNLLSSESGKFLLEDIEQVGDVVLVKDESVMLNEFRTVGLESLVGYNVVTPGQRNLGKVRGYTFSINSGAVESLELDAFGFSIIPSSLVSTYALSTEDVLEVLSDTVVVHEAAASHIQRLTKGFLGTSNIEETSSINLKYRNPREESRQPIKTRKSRRKSSKRKFYPRRSRDSDDDLEFPMDYM